MNNCLFCRCFSLRANFFPLKRRQGSTRKISFDDVNLQIVAPGLCLEFPRAVKRYVYHYSHVIRIEFVGLNISLMSGERVEYAKR